MAGVYFEKAWADVYFLNFFNKYISEISSGLTKVSNGPVIGLNLGLIPKPLVGQEFGSPRTTSSGIWAQLDTARVSSPPNPDKFVSTAGRAARIRRPRGATRKQPPCIGSIPSARFPRCTRRTPLFRIAFGVEEGGGRGSDPAAANGGRERCRGSAARCTAPWKGAAAAAPFSPAPSVPRSAPSSTTPARPSRAAPGSVLYGPNPYQRPSRAPLLLFLAIIVILFALVPLAGERNLQEREPDR
jgi:hypothetical protein